MVVYLRNGIYSKDMARTGTGQWNEPWWSRWSFCGRSSLGQINYTCIHRTDASLNGKRRVLFKFLKNSEYF